MYRQLLRQESEVIAAVAKDWRTFKRWRDEHDFHDTERIKWYYIERPYQIHGRNFNILFLIEDFWRMPDFGRVTSLIHTNMGNTKIRTFSTLEGVKHNFERR